MNKSLPNRPPNVTHFSWARFVSLVLNNAKMAGVCEQVPTTVLNHMRDVLVDDKPDPALLKVAEELRLIKSAIRAGAIISSRIADEKDGKRRVRDLNYIVDEMLQTIETGGNDAIKSVG